MHYVVQLPPHLRHRGLSPSLFASIDGATSHYVTAISSLTKSFSYKLYLSLGSDLSLALIDRILAHMLYEEDLLVGPRSKSRGRQIFELASVSTGLLHLVHGHIETMEKVQIGEIAALVEERATRINSLKEVSEGQLNLLLVDMKIQRQWQVCNGYYLERETKNSLRKTKLLIRTCAQVYSQLTRVEAALRRCIDHQRDVHCRNMEPLPSEDSWVQEPLQLRRTTSVRSV